MSIKKGNSGFTLLLLHNIDQAWEPAEIDQALREVAVFETAVRDMGQPLTTITLRNTHLAACLKDYNPDRHIVFNWCEELPGIPHSEALVPQTLDSLNFTYTGSTSDVLKFCWDKLKVKQLLDLWGVPSPEWRIYDSAKADDWHCFPAIVKPVREHCSLGVTTEAVVLSSDELKNRIAYILDAFCQPALVEDFIDGREFHVSVWGNGFVEMLPPAEMDFGAFDNVRDRLCTYESKFHPDSRHYENIGLKLPAPLRDDEYKGLQRTSMQTYRILGCRDYARLDIRLRDGVFYVLDINPNSDISAEASTACAAEAAGYTYGEMIGRIISFALQRHPRFRPLSIS